MTNRSNFLKSHVPEVPHNKSITMYTLGRPTYTELDIFIDRHFRSHVTPWFLISSTGS